MFVMIAKNMTGYVLSTQQVLKRPNSIFFFSLSLTLFIKGLHSYAFTPNPIGRSWFLCRSASNCTHLKIPAPSRFLEKLKKMVKNKSGSIFFDKLAAIRDHVNVFIQHVLQSIKLFMNCEGSRVKILLIGSSSTTLSRFNKTDTWWRVRKQLQETQSYSFALIRVL